MYTMQVKLNLAANLIGRSISAAISLALVPVYISFIGIEGYGLVGFYATMQAMFNLLDMGFSNTLKRELAAAEDTFTDSNHAGDVLLTLQYFYFGMGALICLIAIILSPLLASHWLNTKNINSDVLTNILILFGFIVSSRMTYGFYASGLLGLQKQVLYNFQDIIFTLTRSGGAVLILWAVSPTVEAFFVWQSIIGFIWTVICALLLWRNLPKRNRVSQFRPSIFKNIWRYTAGFGLNSILGTLLNQIDKVILSKTLSLEMFGYYMLAWTVASSLQYFGTPICTTYFPIFVNYVTKNQIENLRSSYRKATQIMSVSVLPTAGIFIFFSHSLLLAWTKDQFIANQAWLLTSILSLSMALNQIAGLAYNLQLAYKYTRLSVLTNLIAVIFLAPTLYFGIQYFGVIGVAFVYLILNLGYILIFAQVLHRKFLVSNFFQWSTRDILTESLAILIIAVIAYNYMPLAGSRFMLIGKLVLIFFIMTVSAVMTADLIRKPFLSVIKRFLSLPPF